MWVRISCERYAVSSCSSVPSLATLPVCDVKRAGIHVFTRSVAVASTKFFMSKPESVQGKLQEANLAYDEALQHVSFRTRIGGEVTLQKAICLDSLVRLSCICCPFFHAIEEKPLPST